MFLVFSDPIGSENGHGCLITIHETRESVVKHLTREGGKIFRPSHNPDVWTSVVRRFLEGDDTVFHAEQWDWDGNGDGSPLPPNTSANRFELVITRGNLTDVVAVRKGTLVGTTRP